MIRCSLIFLIYFNVYALNIEFKKEVPVELELVSKAVSHVSLTQERYEEVKKNLKTIDGSLRILKSPLSSFVIKSETYKSILEELGPGNRGGAKLTEEAIILAQKKFEENKEYSKFSTWIGNSILKDASNSLRSGKSDPTQNALIQRWVKVILQFSPKQFNLMTHNLAIKIVRNMAEYLKIASITTGSGDPDQFREQKVILFPDLMPAKIIELEPSSSSVQEQMIKEKKQRKQQAKALTEKIKIQPPKPETESKWKPKSDPKPKAPWKPKNDPKKAPQKNEASDKKKKALPKGKVYQLEDV